MSLHIGDRCEVETRDRTSDRSQEQGRQRDPKAAPIVKLGRITNKPKEHQRYRVLVVDDSIVPRTAARAMLGSARELQYVGEAASGAEALVAAEPPKPPHVI